MRFFYLLTLLFFAHSTQIFAETLNPPTVTSVVVPDTCLQSVGSIDITVSGDFPPFTFLWSNGETTEDLTNVEAGDYNVIVTNAHGESSAHFVTVQDIIIPLSLSVETTTPHRCNDLADGTATIVVNPPIPNSTFLWNTGETTQTIQNLPEGHYSAFVLLGSCYGKEKFFLYGDLDYPSSTPTTVNTTCELSNGGINLDVHGELEPYTFEWSNGETTEDLSGIEAGTYMVTVTGYNGCTHTNTIEITNSNPPIPFLGFVKHNTLCDSVNGTINISTTPPSGFTFLWSNGATTEDVSGLEPGEYELTITGQGTCTSSGTYEILDNAAPVDIALIPVHPGCGQSNGEISVSLLSGLPPYTYDWEHIPGTLNPPIAKNLSPGTYTVTVTGLGCSTVASVTLVETNAFTISGTASSSTSCLSPNGSIDISVSPVNVYTYAWSNGSSTQDVSNLPFGIYAVTVTDTLGCKSVFVDTVGTNSIIPQLSLAATPNTRCDLANGSLNLSVQPPGNWAFLWSNGATTEDLVNTLPGIYSVTVRDTLGCMASTQDTITDLSVLPGLTASALANTSCTNVNGSLDVSVLPAGSYQYLWSNMATTEDLTNVAAGNYSLTVSDANGCTGTLLGVVPDQTSAPALSAAVTAAECGLANGGVDITTTGGLAPYQFLWSDLSTTEDLVNTLPGNYSVTVTDANGCSTGLMLNVANNSSHFSLSATPQPNNNCATVNGAINLTVIPAGAYTYLWSNGATTEDVATLPAGTYTVQVTESGSCVASATYFVLNDFNQPNLSSSSQAETCNLADGSADVTVLGGQAPFLFNWSGGQTSEDLSNIAGGNYTVTVTDANLCTAELMVIIPETNINFSLSGTALPNASCNAPNGSIDLEVSSGSGFSYQWSTGSSTQDLSGVAPGLYTVTVSAGGTCTHTAAFTIGNAPTLTATGASGDILCLGDNTGAIDLMVNGGTQPYSFNWSSGLASMEDHINLSAGTYSVTVTDAGDCTATVSFTISQPGSAVQVGCAVLNDVSQAGLQDGNATVQVSGGTAPYTLWINPGGVQNGVPTGSVALNNLGVGTYAVTVTDFNGCATQCGFTINQFTCMTAVGSMGTTAIAVCGPDCITASYDAAGQTMSPGDQLQFILHEGSGATIVNELARNNSPVFCFDQASMIFGKTYYISAVAGAPDGSGNVGLNSLCTVIAPGTPVVFHEKPLAGANTPEPINCVQAQVDILGNASLANATFLWSTLDGIIAGNPNQAGILATQAGSYTLVVAANGCFDTTFVQVTDIRNAPKATIFASPTDILDCVLNEIVLSGNIKGSNHTNAVWFDANGNFYPDGTVLTINTPGTYQFIILDTLTLCADTASITINQNQLYPPLIINPPAQLTCSVGSVLLSGSSPVAGILFEWATVAGLDTTIIGSGANIHVSQPGDYLLLGVDPANGCNNALHVLVTADQSFPTADAGPAFSIDCSGQTLPLSGAATGGGPGGVTYQWSGVAGSILSGSNTLTPFINAPGTYTLVVTSIDNGCSDTDVVVITPNEPVAISTLGQPGCVNTTGTILIDTVLGAKPPFSYTLTGGAFLQADNLFSQLAPGDYTVFIQDAGGCSTSIQATILTAPTLKITVVPQATIALGESYLLDASVNVPASEIDQINWTPQAGLSCDTCLSTLIELPTITQQYIIRVVTKAGCRDDATFLLKVDKSVDVYIPNIFSPNDDGENDGFTIYTQLTGVQNIKLFQIFSRWGEQVFVRENFNPNDPSLGWDGRFRGVPMNPGVFVYYAVVVLADGREVIYKGDVTLMR